MTSDHLLSLYTHNTHVHLTKMSAHRGDDGAFLLTGYWVEGVLQAAITVGETIKLLRHRRPRWPDDPEGTPEVVARLGLFESSKIIRIDQNLLYTQNSIWQIEEANLT